jgi:hypothetical protein
MARRAKDASAVSLSSRIVPVLGAGRHRRAKRGACLMEYTSVIAGERFTDAPPCTDPVLAALARAVNDYIGDASRQRLAPLAARLSVLRDRGIEYEDAIVRRAVLTALPYAADQARRRLLLIALFGRDRAARGVTRGFDEQMLDLDSQLALLGAGPSVRADDVAAAAAVVASSPVDTADNLRRGAPRTIELAVATIAAHADDAAELLYRLLADCVEEAPAVTVEVTGGVPAGHSTF